MEIQQTLLDRFLHWEAQQANKVYLTQPDGGAVAEYTWSEVGEQARRMAAHLKSLKLPTGSSIGILSKNCAHWIVADLAIWMAGHISVPLYPTLNTDTAAYVLDHAAVKLLFVGKLDAPDWDALRAAVPASMPCIALPLAPSTALSKQCPAWDAVTRRHAPLKNVARRKPDELATIIYTSGSTGQPKGAMISFGAMGYCADGMSQFMHVGTDDRMLSYLPLAHAAERGIVETASLRYGFHIYFNDSLATFVSDLKRAKPTLFFSVPRLWVRFYLGIQQKLPPKRQQVLFRLPVISGIVKRKLLAELGLDAVRYALTGSAALSPTIIAWYRDLGLELLEGYGMTENFAYSHFSRPGHSRIGYVGQTNPGVACRIADNGEILVKSPCNMMGYYRDKARTKEAFTNDGFLKTGDRGEMDAEGRLRITGRVKELFKTSKGKYVAPAPIENRLMRHPCVEAVCVTGQDRPQPYALLMLSADAQKALADGAERSQLETELGGLLEEVNTELEPHEVLDFLVVVPDQWTIENNFLTPTMKIRRDVIEARYEPQADAWARSGRDVVWA
jgi:long-subunit acyl-CoA synthetase (AMP-forming)